jgi:ubiquinone/menaquinone biosynthesis C-methylase UbiE
MSNSKMLEANEIYHDSEADAYDESHPYMRNSFAQAMFEEDIDGIVAELAHVGHPLRVLDCGAGTGNLSLKFLDRNCLVTAIDVSSKMLERLQLKAAARRPGRLLTFQKDIDGFLARNTDSYDIVCSSSFLHHLPDYLATYQRFIDHCSSTSILYTAFEPVGLHGQRFSERLLSDLDKHTYEFRVRKLYRPDVFGRAVRNRVVPFARTGSAQALVDHALVEHPELGIDSSQLKALLQQSGFQNISVQWRPVQRQWLTYLIAKHLVHSNNALFLIARRTAA